MICELHKYFENKVVLSLFFTYCGFVIKYCMYSAALNAVVGELRINLKACNGSKMHQMT